MKIITDTYRHPEINGFQFLTPRILNKIIKRFAEIKNKLIEPYDTIYMEDRGIPLSIIVNIVNRTRLLTTVPGIMQPLRSNTTYGF